MILVDTGVWIRFFRGEDQARKVSDLVLENRVILHPYVRGELLLGGLSQKNENLLQALTSCNLADMENLYQFISSRKLTGCGIGLVDAALLSSAVEKQASIWTFDSALTDCAQQCDCSYTP
ncbi:MAG: PIN domain-containing protein [Spirochaetia bacterium]